MSISWPSNPRLAFNTLLVRVFGHGEPGTQPRKVPFKTYRRNEVMNVLITY